MSAAMDEDDYPEIDLENTMIPLTDIDRQILSMKDEDYHRHSWEDLKEIIANNSLETLKRLPSDLRRYFAWSASIKQQYGGIVPFVIQKRLYWTPISPDGPPQFNHISSIPFDDPRDYAVLRNDWPYGFEAGITHLVVWTKTPIETNDSRGDVTAASRQIIEDFVRRYFVVDLERGEERVQWFKNWVSLQSVRGLDHIHVLVKDVPEELIEKWCVRKDL